MSDETVNLEIKKAQEEITKTLHDFQESHKALQVEGKSNSEKLEKMGNSFIDMAKSYEEVKSKLVAEEKARKDLEIAMARGGNQSKNECKSDPLYMQSFSRYLKYKSAIKDELIDSEFKKMMADASGMEISNEELMGLKTLFVGSNPDGGYLVPVERLNIIKTRVFEMSQVRQVSQVMTIGSDSAELVIDDGEFGSTKVGELDARPPTATSQIGLLTIPAHEQYANPVASQRILDDATWNIDAWLSGKLAKRFARIENHEFIAGTAAHEAQGIATVPDWVTLGVYERGKLETRVCTGPGGLIAGDDLIDVQTDLLEDYQANARWFFNRKTWAELMKLKDLNGNYILDPRLLFSGIQLQILGKNVMMSPDLAADAVGSIPSDEVVALYGDFAEGYTIVDRLGMRVLRDPYTAKGFMQFYTTKRTGGAVSNFQAIKRLRTPSNT